MKGNNKENSQNAIGIVPIDTISLIFFIAAFTGLWNFKFIKIVRLKLKLRF